MKNLQRRKKALMVQVKRIQAKLEASIEKNGVILDDEICDDMKQIMEVEDRNVGDMYPEDSFPYIFWKQQRECLSKQGSQKNGIRWHPLMIKLCIYLRHQSSKAYETLRESGCLALPSQRTLRDYTNAVKAVTGFSKEVDEQLIQAARLMTSPDYHKLIVILIDEMHIKEELVYNKHSGKLLGFVDLGNINNHLVRFEESICEDNDGAIPPLANSMVVFMLKGLFSSFQFTYTQFPCARLTGEQLFNIFWESVFRLERIGFKVNLSLTIHFYF
jgi:hypothetical protein